METYTAYPSTFTYITVLMNLKHSLFGTVAVRNDSGFGGISIAGKGSSWWLSRAFGHFPRPYVNGRCVGPNVNVSQPVK